MKIDIVRWIVDRIGNLGRKCIELEYRYHAGQLNKRIEKLLPVATGGPTQSVTGSKGWYKRQIQAIAEEHPNFQHAYPVSVAPATEADRAYAMENLSPPKKKVG